ncbi:MAG: S41 family peptidase [Candidatus Merdivicinus sp.]|jgi:hypothetical protein
MRNFGIRKFLTFAVLVSVLCTGCGAATTGSESSETIISNEVSEQEISSSGELDSEAFLEDYDYFWTMLRENCPLLEPAKRSGIDVDQMEADYRTKVETCPNLEKFMWIMGKINNDFDGFGHICVLDWSQYQTLRELYLSGGESRAIQNEILNRDDVKEVYKEFGIPSNHAKVEPPTLLLSASTGVPASSSQVTAEEISPETLLVTIPTFSSDAVEFDGELLRQIYTKAAASGKENLILDLTENGGGSDLYWEQNIVGPNITDPQLIDTYALLPMTEFNTAYYEAYGIMKYAHPISELPDFPNLNPDDIAMCDQFVYFQTLVEPTEDAPLFEGKIWVLTSPKVFSASESFVQFCKQSGFATLVGEQTGGDGVGIGDPFLMELPNTHLVVRYTGAYGLNEDGSCNAEMGTQPDIVPQEGESSLDACLRAIAETSE